MGEMHVLFITRPHGRVFMVVNRRRGDPECSLLSLRGEGIVPWGYCAASVTVKIDVDITVWKWGHLNQIKRPHS